MIITSSHLPFRLMDGKVCWSFCFTIPSDMFLENEHFVDIVLNPASLFWPYRYWWIQERFH